MSKSNRGLRIGGFRIKPLGLLVLVFILLIVAACVLLFAGKPFEVGGDGFLSPSATPSPTPVPTPTPSPTPTPEPTPRVATIRTLGEIAIQSSVLKSAKQDDGSYDFSEIFSEVSDIMGDADFTIADVEGSLGGTKTASGGTKLRTPPSLIQALSDCGVDMLNFANDHSLDGGWADLKAAMENCNSAGMHYIGAASSLMERNTAKVVEINGIHVGFVAYTATSSVKPSGDAKEFGISLAANAKPKTDIQACRDAGAEIVVACVSWGKMNSRKVTKNQLAMAKKLVQSGADVIIGYHPRVVQAARWLEMKNSKGKVTRRALCLLSNGDFLSGSRKKYSDSGVVFQFTIKENKDMTALNIVSPVYIPTYIWRIENEDKSYDYRVLPCGRWLESTPEGMNYTQGNRLREVWAETQSTMGSSVAKVAKE